MNNLPKVRASDLFGGDDNIHDAVGCACGAQGHTGISARGRLRNETIFTPKRESDKIDADNSPATVYVGVPITGITTVEYPNGANLPKDQNVCSND